MTDDLSTLTQLVSRRRRELDAKSGEARALLTRGKAIKEELVTLEADMAVYDRVTTLLNSLGEDRQNEAQGRIEELVTRGIQTIFDASLSFHILQVSKAKTTGVEFIVRTTLSDGSSIDTNVMDDRGGGLATTIGFLLRLVVMLVKNGPDADNILILDETFAQVSAEYLEPLGEFVKELVERTGVQILLVTHQPEFLAYADKAYRFTSVDGKTKVLPGE